MDPIRPDWSSSRGLPATPFASRTSVRCLASLFVAGVASGAALARRDIRPLAHHSLLAVSALGIVMTVLARLFPSKLDQSSLLALRKQVGARIDSANYGLVAIRREFPEACRLAVITNVDKRLLVSEDLDKLSFEEADNRHSFVENFGCFTPRMVETLQQKYLEWKLKTATSIADFIDNEFAVKFGISWAHVPKSMQDIADLRQQLKNLTKIVDADNVRLQKRESELRECENRCAENQKILDAIPVALKQTPPNKDKMSQVLLELEELKRITEGNVINNVNVLAHLEIRSSLMNVKEKSPTHPWLNFILQYFPDGAPTAKEGIKTRTLEELANYPKPEVVKSLRQLFIKEINYTIYRRAYNFENDVLKPALLERDFKLKQIGEAKTQLEIQAGTQRKLQEQIDALSSKVIHPK